MCNRLVYSLLYSLLYELLIAYRYLILQMETHIETPRSTIS